MNIKSSAKEEKKSAIWREQVGKGNPPPPDAGRTGRPMTRCSSYVCLCHSPHPAPGSALIIWTPDRFRGSPGALGGLPVRLTAAALTARALQSPISASKTPPSSENLCWRSNLEGLGISPSSWGLYSYFVVID